MDSFLQDVRYALRQLTKSPAFTVTAVVTLALGIGANTAIYSLLDQVMLRSLPVHDPEQLVMLNSSGSDRGRISAYGGRDRRLLFLSDVQGFARQEFCIQRPSRDRSSAGRSSMAQSAGVGER
jgi:hypothetical protein